MWTNGNIGPNISSCIIGSVGLTFTSIVGSMYFSLVSVLPPIATSPFVKKVAKRLKKNDA